MYNVTVTIYPRAVSSVTIYPRAQAGQLIVSLFVSFCMRAVPAQFLRMSVSHDHDQDHDHDHDLDHDPDLDHDLDRDLDHDHDLGHDHENDLKMFSSIRIKGHRALVTSPTNKALWGRTHVCLRSDTPHF